MQFPFWSWNCGRHELYTLRRVHGGLPKQPTCVLWTSGRHSIIFLLGCCVCVSVCVLYVHIKTDTLPHLHAPCKQMCLNEEKQQIHVLVRLGIFP